MEATTECLPRNGNHCPNVEARTIELDFGALEQLLNAAPGSTSRRQMGLRLGRDELLRKRRCAGDMRHPGLALKSEPRIWKRTIRFAVSIGPFSAFKEVDTPKAADQGEPLHSTLTSPTRENCEGPLFSAVSPPFRLGRYDGELSMALARRNLCRGRSTGKIKRKMGQSRKYQWSPAR